MIRGDELIGTYERQLQTGDWPSGLLESLLVNIRAQTRASTFARTIAAVLREPMHLDLAAPGLLTEHSRQRHSSWICEHLQVVAVPVPAPQALTTVEGAVLSALDPPLSLDGMPRTTPRRRLSELRSRLEHPGSSAPPNVGSAPRVFDPTRPRSEKEMGAKGSATGRAVSTWLFRRDYPTLAASDRASSNLRRMFPGMLIERTHYRFEVIFSMRQAAQRSHRRARCLTAPPGPADLAKQFPLVSRKRDPHQRRWGPLHEGGTMSKLHTKLAVAATAVAVPLAMGLTAASASTPSYTPPAGSVFSPEQFAYQVTGSDFRAAQETFNLPNAAAFAGNIGGFGISTQLWSANNVVVLGLSDTTTSSPWSPGIAIFDTITHAVICAEASCGVPSTWTAGLSYPASDNVTESLGYNSATGNLGVKITDHTNAAKDTLFYHHIGGGILYNQVRLGAEVGDTPWSGGVAYNPPGAVRGLTTLTGVSLTNTAGRTGSISSALWHHAPVTWTRNGLSSGGVNGVVGRLTSGGASFIPFLTP